MTKQVSHADHPQHVATLYLPVPRRADEVKAILEELVSNGRSGSVVYDEGQFYIRGEIDNFSDMPRLVTELRERTNLPNIGYGPGDKLRSLVKVTDVIANSVAILPAPTRRANHEEAVQRAAARRAERTERKEQQAREKTYASALRTLGEYAYLLEKLYSLDIDRFLTTDTSAVLERAHALGADFTTIEQMHDPARALARNAKKGLDVLGRYYDELEQTRPASQFDDIPLRRLFDVASYEPVTVSHQDARALTKQYREAQAARAARAHFMEHMPGLLNEARAWLEVRRVISQFERRLIPQGFPIDILVNNQRSDIYLPARTSSPSAVAAVEDLARGLRERIAPSVTNAGGTLSEPQHSGLVGIGVCAARNDLTALVSNALDSFYPTTRVGRCLPRYDLKTKSI